MGSVAEDVLAMFDAQGAEDLCVTQRERSRSPPGRTSASSNDKRKDKDRYQDIIDEALGSKLPKELMEKIQSIVEVLSKDVKTR